MARGAVIIADHLRQQLARDSRRFLVNVSAGQMTRLNLTILRICLLERNERGIYLSVDKPDAMVIQILERHQITGGVGANTGTGTGPEATGALERAERALQQKKILVVSGIFCPTLFLDSLDRAASSAAGAGLIEELRGMHFLLVDNLAVMAAYNSRKKIEEFFQRLDALLTRFPNLRGILMTDKRDNPEIYELARGVSEVEIQIKDDVLAQR